MIESKVYHKYDMPKEGWQKFRKKTITHMIRMEGQFACITIDGNTVTCEDGWLAVDDHGYPYPIAAKQQERSYEPVERED